LRLLALLLMIAPLHPTGAAEPMAALGLPPLTLPASRAVAAQVALGEKLFFDRRLSVNDTLSCAMCHVPAQGFTVNELRTSVGMEGVSLRRNAPTLLNVAYAKALFVDGRASSLEAQALQPLVHPDEMANRDIAAAMARIASLRDYRRPLQRAFGSRKPTPQRIAAALAAFERTLVAAGSPFDHWRYGGRADALNTAEQRGYALFVERGCVACHHIGAHDALLTDDEFHNVGVQAHSEAQGARDVKVTLVPGVHAALSPQAMRRIGVPDAPDRGREEVTGLPGDLRAYRTPSLRNVALTAPYMHDGSFATLEQVLDYYAAGGTPQDTAQDPRIRPFALSAADRDAMVAFLRSLTSPAAAELARRAPQAALESKRQRRD
jgi:cytochrome c peroxidase